MSIRARRGVHRNAGHGAADVGEFVVGVGVLARSPGAIEGGRLSLGKSVVGPACMPYPWRVGGGAQGAEFVQEADGVSDSAWGREGSRNGKVAMSPRRKARMVRTTEARLVRFSSGSV